MTEYKKVSTFLESFPTMVQRMQALDALIDQAILKMADNIDGAPANISYYEHDDGQVRIKTNYRSMDDLAKGIKALESLKIMYLSRLRGRVTTLIDKHCLR